MSTQLKVKAKSLAAESAIIRKEERKALGAARWCRSRQDKAGEDLHSYRYENLHEHRKGIVRREARLTGLARAYIKGLAYKDVENKVKPDKELGPNHFRRLAKMVCRYGGKREKFYVSDAQLNAKIPEVMEWAKYPYASVWKPSK